MIPIRDSNVQAMITLMAYMEDMDLAVRERPLNLITHPLLLLGVSDRFEICDSNFPPLLSLISVGSYVNTPAGETSWLVKSPLV